MKKYRYEMTKQEITEFVVRMIVEDVKRVWSKWMLLLGICILECIIVPGAGLVVVFFLLAVVALYFGRNFTLARGRLSGRTREMWVEDGVLKLDTEGEHNEISCAAISLIRITPHLLMLGYYQAPRRIGWYPLPLREFADRAEREIFLGSIRNPQAGTEDRGSGACETEEEYFRFSFRIERENWIQALAEATEIIRAGTFGRQKKGWRVWVACAAVLVAGLVFLAVRLPDSALFFLTAAFILAIVTVSLLQALKEHPERRVRAQIARGSVQNNIYGDWQVWMTATGVRQNVPNQGNLVLPWGNLRYLVETDTGLYLFKQDEKQFLMIPRACLEDSGQARGVKELCREKGLAVTAGKRMRFAPGWLFPLLRFLVIAGYVAASVRLLM